VSENVIHLAFRSPHVEDDERAMLACKNCRNKTYLLICDKLDTFPLMQCGACGMHMGRMGWAHDDDPALA
jgi:hypothetical protein